jgi:hypothetical protein
MVVVAQSPMSSNAWPKPLLHMYYKPKIDRVFFTISIYKVQCVGGGSKIDFLRFGILGLRQSMDLETVNRSNDVHRLGLLVFVYSSDFC